MHKGRLEAFSDGVLAIIITIMVLELHVPHGTDLTALQSAVPIFLSYVLSFIYVGIYWNNHHHLFQAVDRVSGGVLWANLHLLFWLSLFPFATAWMGENRFAKIPVAVYGAVLLLAAIAYFVLVRVLQGVHRRNSTLVRSIGTDRKGQISMVVYAAGIAASFFSTGVALGLYTLVAAGWFLPDPRIEQEIAK